MAAFLQLRPEALNPPSFISRTSRMKGHVTGNESEVTKVLTLLRVTETFFFLKKKKWPPECGRRNVENGIFEL